MIYDEKERLKRKEATALDFTVKKNSKGEILNPEVVGKTVQSAKDRQDTNKIMERYRNTGVMDPRMVNPPKRHFGNFDNSVTYADSLNAVLTMQREFDALPPRVRYRFENNPKKLLEFLEDPKNRKEAIELGIVPKPVITRKKIETPEGFYWVTFEDDVESNRVKVPDAAAPAAPAGSGR